MLLPQECVVRIASEVVSRLLIIGTSALLIEVFDSYMPTNVENQHVRIFPDIQMKQVFLFHRFSKSQRPVGLS